MAADRAEGTIPGPPDPPTGHLWGVGGAGPGGPPPEREAIITVRQLSNGYWQGHVAIRRPGLIGQHVESLSSFHDAGEALDWASSRIEDVVSR